MASVSQTSAARPLPGFAGRNGIVDKYFYFAMSLVIAAIVVAGFSRTVDQNLFHPSVPRPAILWVHGATFSLWVVFFIFQSALVRTRNVKIHRTTGWFGVGLAAFMVPLGVTTAVIMARFDTSVKHEKGADAFLIVPLYDMVAFAVCAALAILWRKNPELHRRLFFIATCGLLDAAFGRWDYLFDHGLIFACLDGVILLGVVRDLVINKRIHRVYLTALPVLFVVQWIVVSTWRGNAGWWIKIADRIMG
jgi:FtsH-binding integral membrane protein